MGHWPSAGPDVELVENIFDETTSWSSWPTFLILLWTSWDETEEEIGLEFAQIERTGLEAEIDLFEGEPDWMQGGLLPVTI